MTRTPSDLTALSLREAGAGIASRAVSSRELVEASLARIAATDGKLGAFLAIGAFVVFGIFDGPRDVFRAARLPPVDAPSVLGEHGLLTWLAHLLLSGFAILLLPRQFHLAVVENADAETRFPGAPGRVGPARPETDAQGR